MDSKKSTSSDVFHGRSRSYHLIKLTNTTKFNIGIFIRLDQQLVIIPKSELRNQDFIEALQLKVTLSFQTWKIPSSGIPQDSEGYLQLLQRQILEKVHEDQGLKGRL